jgi:Tfp pilus assembly protein PilO
MRRQVELALAIVGMVLIAAVGWLLLIRPQTNQAAADADREALALATADTLRNDIAERRELQRQAGALEQRVQALDKLFPPRPQVAELTEALQTAADQTSVELLSIQPGTPTRGTDADKLARVPFQLSVRGGYFQLADFLNRLETLTPTNAAETGPTSRAVLVTTVTVSAGGDAATDTGGTAADQALTAAVSLIAFQSTQEPAVSTTTPGQADAGAGGATPPTTTTPPAGQSPDTGTPG